MDKKLDSEVIEASSEHRFSVIWLHGLGADGHDFVPLAPQLKIAQADHTRFIFPHAPVRPVTLNGGMPMRAWFDIAMLDTKRSVNHNEVMSAIEQINDLIDAERSRGIPSKNIVLAGFSQGASLALMTGLTYQSPLNSIIALSGYLTKDSYQHIAQNSHNQQTKLFMAHGTSDMIVPLNMGRQTKDQLDVMGFDVSWHEYAMDHSVCLDEIQDLHQFLTSQGM